MLHKFRSLSFSVMTAICILIACYRITHVYRDEISWDVFGYYLPLPATIIHHDPALKSSGWIKEVNEKYELSPTLYTVSSNDNGEPMYVFLFGMAFLYLPFFLLGHGTAHAMGYATDGFSMPYQYSMVLGGIFFTIIGLVYFRKVLLHFFPEKLTALLMFIIVFGTNYIHHMTLKDLETVNVLFMLVCIITWNTIRWHERGERKNLIALGMALTMMALVKPSESLIILLPLFWNIRSLTDFGKKFSLLWADKKGLLIALVICALMVTPQIYYWHALSGHYIYDTYKNPGVGLDLSSPHFAEVLFSYRKGWLVYTPIMIFSIIGFYFVYKSRREIFWAILIHVLVAFYILSSWTYWHYGAAFSCRPLITSYPLLAICFGYFLLSLSQKKKWLKILFACFTAVCIFLNQFQWWQLKHNVLDPYRTTKEYYWAVFLKTRSTPEDNKLLLVNRDFSGENHFADPDRYEPHELPLLVSQWSSNEQRDSLGNAYYHVNKGQEYGLTNKYTYGSITLKDHAWIKVSMDLRYPKDYKCDPAMFAFSMQNELGSYGYYAGGIPNAPADSAWHHYEIAYLTPEVRSTKDTLLCYLWNRAQYAFDIDNFKIEAWERKK